MNVFVINISCVCAWFWVWHVCVLHTWYTRMSCLYGSVQVYVSLCTGRGQRSEQRIFVPHFPPPGCLSTNLGLTDLARRLARGFLGSSISAFSVLELTGLGTLPGFLCGCQKPEFRPWRLCDKQFSNLALPQPINICHFFSKNTHLENITARSYWEANIFPFYNNVFSSAWFLFFWIGMLLKKSRFTDR